MTFLALAGGAQAAEPARDLAAECLGFAESTADAVACRGAYARDCMSRDGGETTIGMSACVLEESDGWDLLLNEIYADLVLLSRRRAIRAEEEGRPAPPLEPMLRDAQRAWIAFRDADCDQEYAIWGDGSQRQVASAWCLLDRTATRVLELRAKREQMELD